MQAFVDIQTPHGVATIDANKVVAVYETDGTDGEGRPVVRVDVERGSLDDSFNSIEKHSVLVTRIKKAIIGR